MPTILREGPYRFFFYAGDGNEPPHVHVERDAFEAKFWLEPIELERNNGFSSKEIHRVQLIVETHKDRFMECWNEIFDH